MKKLFTSLFLLTLIVSLLCSAPVMADETLTFKWTQAPNNVVADGDFSYSGDVWNAVRQDWSDTFVGFNGNVTATSRSTYALNSGTFTFTLRILWRNENRNNCNVPKIQLNDGTPFTHSQINLSDGVPVNVEYSVTVPSIGSYTIKVITQDGDNWKFGMESLTIPSAAFATTYSVLATASNGSVVGIGSYAAGATVTLTPNPDPYYAFSSWSELSGITIAGYEDDNPLTFTMPGNAVSVTANFVSSPCTNTLIIQCEDYVSYNTKPSGSNDNKPGNLKSKDYTGYGDPIGGYYADFDNSTGEMWIPVTLPAGTFTFTVRYVKGGDNMWFNLYDVSNNSKIDNSKKLSQKGGSWDSDVSNSYTLTSGDYVIGIYGNDNYTGLDQITITASSNVFCLTDYEISLVNTEGGSAAPTAEVNSSAVTSAESGTTVTVTAAEANSGYYFSGWTASPAVEFADATSATTTFTMPASAVTITANYSASVSNTLTYTAIGSGNISCATASGTNVSSGTEIELTATPDPDYTFTGWSSSDIIIADASANPLMFTMPGNAVSLTANFTACTKHTVTLTAGDNGSVSGGGEFCDGSVTVTASPNSGYRFVNWTNTSTSDVVSNDAEYTFTLLADISLTANFEYNPCTDTKLIEAEDYIDGYSAYHFPNGDPKITEDASASNGKYFEFNGNDEYKDGEINYYVYLPAATYSVEIKHRNGKDKYLNIYAEDAGGDVTYNDVKFRKMSAYNPNLGNDYCGDWKTFELDNVEITTGGYYLIGLYGKQYAMFDYVKFTANTGVFCSRTITMEKSGDASAAESTSSVGSAMVGTEITITAGTASDNHYFVNWSASPAVEFADATSETTTFVMPDADVTITANYASYIYTRDISGAGWGTLCLPMDGAVEGATLFSVAGKQEENSKLYVVLQEEPTLVGGQPYIFKKTADELRATMSGPQTPSPATVNGLVGTYVEISSLTPYDDSNKNYILAKNGDDVEFQKVGDNVTVGEYRAYMNLDGVPAYSPSQAIPGRRYVMMGVSGTQETEDTEDISAVEEVESGKVLSGKILINGQLYLMYEGKMYDVRGARVK